MTQFLHKTNRLSDNAPSASEIAHGELCLNTFALGNASDGINVGRIYMKTDSNEVRRFVSLGLEGSNDPSLKIRYGGTNNTFNSVSSDNTDGGDSILIFKYNVNDNHLINKTATDKLTWHSGNNRLNINRSVGAQATLHVGGTLAIDTADDWNTTFNSNFQILGRDSSDSNKLKKVSSNSFASLFDNNTFPVTKLSGAIPLTNGGTGGDLTSFSPTEGALLYYSVSGNRFAFDNDARWDSLNQVLVLTGGLEFDPPPDNLLNATPIGVDSTDRIVRMSNTFNQDLTTSSNVDFNKLTLNNTASATDAFIISNIATDGGSYTAVPIGIDSSDRVVKMYYTYNQNLNTNSSVEFEQITIDGGSSAGQTIILNNIQTSTGGSALEIDAYGNVYQASSTRRLKENIVDYTKGLDDVMLLNPKYFNMINDPDKNIRAGLIAEDLVDIGLDEFVVKNKDNNPISISYDKIVILLINSIKQLKLQLDNLSN